MLHVGFRGDVLVLDGLPLKERRRGSQGEVKEELGQGEGESEGWKLDEVTGDGATPTISIYNYDEAPPSLSTTPSSRLSAESLVPGPLVNTGPSSGRALFCLDTVGGLWGPG